MNPDDDRRAVSVAKGEGDTPAMNRPGPEAEADRDLPPPGNRGWDRPADEEPQTIERAVGSERTDPDSPGEALARDDTDDLPEPNEPG